MRPAEAQRDAEALSVADGDVGAEFARGAQEREGQQIRRDDGRARRLACAALMVG